MNAFSIFSIHWSNKAALTLEATVPLGVSVMVKYVSKMGRYAEVCQVMQGLKLKEPRERRDRKKTCVESFPFDPTLPHGHTRARGPLIRPTTALLRTHTRTYPIMLSHLAKRYSEWRESNLGEALLSRPDVGRERMVDAYVLHDIALSLSPLSLVKKTLARRRARRRKEPIEDLVNWSQEHADEAKLPAYSLVVNIREHAQLAEEDELSRPPRVLPWILGAAGILSTSRARGFSLPWSIMGGVYSICAAWHFYHEFHRDCYNPVLKLRNQADEALHAIWNTRPDPQVDCPHPLHYKLYLASDYDQLFPLDEPYIDRNCEHCHRYNPNMYNKPTPEQ